MKATAVPVPVDKPGSSKLLRKFAARSPESIRLLRSFYRSKQGAATLLSGAMVLSGLGFRSRVLTALGSSIFAFVLYPLHVASSWRFQEAVGVLRSNRQRFERAENEIAAFNERVERDRTELADYLDRLDAKLDFNKTATNEAINHLSHRLDQVEQASWNNSSPVD